MRHLLLALTLAFALVGCGTAATQPTAAPAAADISAGVVDKSGAQPGLFFTYPAGWQLEEADTRALFVYSAPDAGLRLFSPGLQVGEVVVQVSATPRSRVESDLANYAISLVETTGTTHQEPQPITVNGFEGYQVSGERPEFIMTVTVTEQQGEIVEVISYVHPADADAQRPVIDAILNSAIWKVPTE